VTTETQRAQREAAAAEEEEEKASTDYTDYRITQIEAETERQKQKRERFLNEVFSIRIGVGLTGN
jgi:hypothetical protein